MPVDGPNDASTLHGADRGTPPASDGADLRSVLVRYESSPDRRTLYPGDADERERMTRWISADDDAFVDLAASR